jgi:carbonic anhydrase
LREGDGGFDYKIYESKDDAVTKDYRNQIDATVKTLKDTTKVPLTTEVNTANTFTSQLANSVFGAGKTWDGVQFHMHSGSEHTVNGKRFDLEMHTVHLPDGETALGADSGNSFYAAAMGLIFDVDDYDKSVTEDQIRIIDTFFDSMKWNEAEPVVDVVSYGAIMEMADFENRWVYKVSVTTPPCAINVYWNVLSTVYPIKQEHLTAFKARLDAGTPGLAALGNYRKINEINGQDVIYVKKGLAS